MIINPVDGVIQNSVITQTSTPQSACLLNKNLFDNIPTNSKSIILFNDDQYKFHLINGDTFEHLMTINGPCYEKPITLMIHHNQSKEKNENYIIFSTNKSIGIQILPIDGDPLGRIGLIGSSNKIQTIRLSFNGKFLFVLSENEYSITMWDINTK